MPEIGMSGSMSGVGKRSQLATAPNLDSTELFEKWVNLYKPFDYQDLPKKQSVFFKLFKLPLNIAFEDLENNSG